MVRPPCKLQAMRFTTSSRRCSSLPSLCVLCVLCVLGVLSVSVGVACSTSAAEDPDSDGLRAGERKIVGAARAYPADTTMRSRTEELRSSMSKRRKAAWAAIARTVAPVTGTAIAKSTSGAVTRKEIALPLFRTWYGADDYGRLFNKLYGDAGSANRVARKPFSSAEIDAAFAWNATYGGSWVEEDYLKRIKKLQDTRTVQGLGGNGRVSYSPGYVRHFLNNYGAVNRCFTLLPNITDATPAPSATNFSQCYNEEFPSDAAVIKASWRRTGASSALPKVDTSAEALRAHLAATGGKASGWPSTEDVATMVKNPNAATIYSVTMTDGSDWRMPALHLITKELRDWLWVTIWWSPDADKDFGADRPQEIRALGGPWSNYKMCVVTAFDEMDPDPRGGFAGSLGDSLAATYGGVGAPSWCSNPFIEKGEHNAQTNCIGCHQHAGSTTPLEEVIGNNAKHPKSGRTKERASFPTDYSWSYDHAPEAFSEVIRSAVQNYDAVDAR